MKFYIQKIKEVLAEIGLENLDPRHVYAYMQLQSTKLVSLSTDELHAEIMVSAYCADSGLTMDNEILAKSFNL